MLGLLIKKQTIEITNDEWFIRETVGAKCSIELDICWNSYTKTVVFKHSSSQIESKKIIINSLKEEVEIPWEILQTSGAFKIGFFATSDTEVLPTLWSGLIEIKSGTNTNGTAPTDYTPSEIEQLKLQKQNKLTAGTNIVIENDVISAIGGGGGSGIVVDTTYNPDSYNAQSGKALSPVFQRKIELWQPNTEYKERDEVLGFYQDWDYDGYSYMILMKCLKSHTSPDDIDYPNLAEDFNKHWSYISLRSEIAHSAVTDSEHNYISETYATKKELSEDINALTKYINDNFATFSWVFNGYVSGETFQNTIGDIETALDSIIAIQNELIGGNTQ